MHISFAWKKRLETLYLFFFFKAKPSNETHYFNDGHRRIDMVLAYQQQDDKERSKRKLEVFEKHLKEEGLEIEIELETVIKNKYKF